MHLLEGNATELAQSLLGDEIQECRPFGAGKFSQTFSVETGAGDTYVLRVAPPDSMLQLFYEYRMMRQEPHLHQRLLAETSVPVPEILNFDFSRELIDRDYLIMPRLPGIPLNQARLRGSEQERAFEQWGSHVAEIHSLKDPQNRFGYLGEHNCMEPQSSWKDAFLLMFAKELEDIASRGVYDRETVSGLMRLLTDHARVFENCSQSRLCHGDLWITNLLVSDGGSVSGVLDFDRACWGDLEWDLAIAEYCGVTRPSFWKGYGRRLETHSGDAAIRRLFYLLYEHQKYIVISMSSRRNDPQRAQNYARESLAAAENFRRTGQPRF